MKNYYNFFSHQNSVFFKIVSSPPADRRGRGHPRGVRLEAGARGRVQAPSPRPAPLRDGGQWAAGGPHEPHHSVCVIWEFFFSHFLLFFFSLLFFFLLHFFFFTVKVFLQVVLMSLITLCGFFWEFFMPIYRRYDGNITYI